MNPRPARQNTSAELEAFDAACERLAGFDPAISFEWVDGFLAALAAGPRLPPPEDWLPAMCGDAFERAYADPEDHARGLQALQARLKVLCDQLDPEALLDAPDGLREFRGNGGRFPAGPRPATPHRESAPGSAGSSPSRCSPASAAA